MAPASNTRDMRIPKIPNIWGGSGKEKEKKKKSKIADTGTNACLRQKSMIQPRHRSERVTQTERAECDISHTHIRREWENAPQCTPSYARTKSWVIVFYPISVYVLAGCQCVQCVLVEVGTEKSVCRRTIISVW